jgi:hypothetical protein
MSLVIGRGNLCYGLLSPATLDASSTIRYMYGRISCAIRSKIRITFRNPNLRLVTGTVDLRVVINHVKDSKNMAAPTTSLNG